MASAGLGGVPATRAAPLIYIYCAQEKARAITRLKDVHGHRQVVGFTSLGDCITEALDETPDLLVLDILQITTEVIVHLIRIRSDAYAGRMKILIRAQAIDEGVLARLYAHDVFDVVMGLMTDEKFIQRVSEILAGRKTLDSVRDKVERNVRMDGAGQFASHFETLAEGFGSRINLCPQAVTEALPPVWGVLQITDTCFGIYFGKLKAARLAVEAHINRIHSLLRSEGLTRLDPAEAISQISQQMAAFFGPDQSAAFYYGVIDIGSNTLVSAGSAAVAAYVSHARATLPVVLNGPEIAGGYGDHRNTVVAFPPGGSLVLAVDGATSAHELLGVLAEKLSQPDADPATFSQEWQYLLTTSPVCILRRNP